MRLNSSGKGGGPDLSGAPKQKALSKTDRRIVLSEKKLYEKYLADGPSYSQRRTTRNTISTNATTAPPSNITKSGNGIG